MHSVAHVLDISFWHTSSIPVALHRSVHSRLLLAAGHAGVVVQLCPISARLEKYMMMKAKTTCQHSLEHVGLSLWYDTERYHVRKHFWMMFMNSSRTGWIIWLTCTFAVRVCGVTTREHLMAYEVDPIIGPVCTSGIDPVCQGCKQVECRCSLCLHLTNTWPLWGVLSQNQSSLKIITDLYSVLQCALVRHSSGRKKSIVWSW